MPAGRYAKVIVRTADQSMRFGAADNGPDNGTLDYVHQVAGTFAPEFTGLGSSTEIEAIDRYREQNQIEITLNEGDEIWRVEQTALGATTPALRLDLLIFEYNKP